MFIGWPDQREFFQNRKGFNTLRKILNMNRIHKKEQRTWTRNFWKPDG